MRRARAALLATLVAVAAGGCGAGTGPRGAEPAGAPISDFSLRDLDGRVVRLSDHLHRDVIVLNFWATWCVPCAAEMPHLQRLYETYRDRGLTVLAISMDGPESAANVDSFARRYGLSFPVLIDAETRVVGVYNPKRSAPFSVLIGRDGAVAMTHEGYSAGDEIALEARIRALLEAERP